MALHALIPAAGSGTRFGGALPKQYQQLAGRPMLAWSLAAFAAVPEVASVTVVLAPGDVFFDALQLPAEVVRAGGATRHASVLNALDVLATRAVAPLADDDWILVHDAARPGITPALLRTLITTLGNDPVGGLLALPVADTLKRAADGCVAATVPRDGLWQAQPPQMFRFGLLRQALRAALDQGLAVTDEASAVEAAGYRPRLIPGSLRNAKVTWPDDQKMVEHFLAMEGA